MKKINVAATVLISTILTACGGGGGNSTPSTPPVVVAPPVLDTTFKSSCIHNEASSPIMLARFNVTTNDWGVYGKPLTYSFRNCISARNVTEESVAATIEWSLPQIGEQGVGYDIKSYPAIIYGHQLNGAYTMNSHLPIPVNAITPTLAANYEVEVQETGWSQTFFDVVFTSGRANNTLTTDIAVMVTKTPYAVQMDSSEFVETVTIDGVTYDVFAHKRETPRFSIFFYPRTNKLSGSLKVKLFSDYLLSKNFLNANDYLDGIEFGTEVISGTGKTEIKSYSITK